MWNQLQGMENCVFWSFAISLEVLCFCIFLKSAALLILFLLVFLSGFLLIFQFYFLYGSFQAIYFLLKGMLGSNPFSIRFMMLCR
jgi:hypothetical protein